MKDYREHYKKGLTLIEVIIILALLSIFYGFFITFFKISNFFVIARDNQRINDLVLLNSVLNLYLQNATSIDLDGPYLSQRAIDEATPTIFVSVPSEVEYFPPYSTNSIAYQVYQQSRNNYRAIDGKGWIPIDFTEISYTGNISQLPVDPINTKEGNFFYLYAFRVDPFGYELSCFLEYPEFQRGGKKDKVSRDGGNDDQRFEIGTNLEIIPPFYYNII